MFEDEKKARLSDMIQQVFSMLDGDAFPQTAHALSVILAEANEGKLPAPLALANGIMDLDKPCIFPDYVIDFVTELYEMEIAEGSDVAMNDLGARYYDGSRGFGQSFEKAVSYYKLAAEHGNRQAQENLGYCYYYGRNMNAPDYEKAFHYFALGAFDGHLISLYKIGDMYLNGYYVPKNEKEAYEIYQRCLETMTDEAAPYAAGPVFLRLGRMYLNGLGTDRDLKAALICFQKAESFLYDMVKEGSVMYKNSLRAAVEGQAKARALLISALPDDEWTADN